MSMDGKFDVIGQTEKSLPRETDDIIGEETRAYELSAVNDSDKLSKLIKLQKEQSELFAEKITELKTLRWLRVIVSVCIFVLIVYWLTTVMELVYLGSYQVQYFQGVCTGFIPPIEATSITVLPEGCSPTGEPAPYLKLPESIMIALITTTTINVLGLAFIVANWLFPSEKKLSAPKLSPDIK